MALGVRILSSNLSGETASVVFTPSTGGTVNIGSVTIPFNYVAGYVYGTYDITVDTYDYTYQVEVTVPPTTATPTPTTTATPTPTTTVTSTPTPTPTITSTPTQTLTNTPTQSVTPTQTVTPTVSVTSTLTPTATPTQTVTPTVSVTATNTPTQTVTRTPTTTPTLTPTQTVTPSSGGGGGLNALLFMESTDDATFSGPDNTDIGNYMVNNATSWYGFQTSGVVDINAGDLAIYMDWPGFITGTTNVPAVIVSEVPQSGGGTDDFGNAIEAYKFKTVEVAGNSTTGNVWYAVFVPPSLTSTQVYQTIGINANNQPTSLTNTSTESTIYVINVNYTGSNWPQGIYKVYTQSAQGNGFDIGTQGVTDSTNNYFRGGTLISI